jgi:hypothetical protein
MGPDTGLSVGWQKHGEKNVGLANVKVCNLRPFILFIYLFILLVLKYVNLLTPKRLFIRRTNGIWAASLDLILFLDLF